MKSTIHYILKAISFSFLFLIFFTPVFAQGPPQPPGGILNIPVDGGIGFLIAAGAAYGAKKIYEHRKNKEK